MRTFTKEEVAVLLAEANYTGYTQGYSDRKADIARKVSDRKKLSKKEVRRILQHAESILE